MSDKSVMTARQAAELDHALGRNNWTPEDVKNLSAGETLGPIRSVVRGYAKVVPITDTIDCDVEPYTPEHFNVHAHQRGGKFFWDPKRILLYSFEHLREEGGGVSWDRLMEVMSGKKLPNACILDYALQLPMIIPEEWKAERILFLGTRYQHQSGDYFVRFLMWDGSQWTWQWLILDSRLGWDYRVAILTTA